MRRRLAIGTRLSTIFVCLHGFFVDRHDFRWPLVSCINSCVQRYGFGRRNPYFCMR